MHCYIFLINLYCLKITCLYYTWSEVIIQGKIHHRFRLVSVVTHVSPPKNCFLLHKNPMRPYFFCIGLFLKKAKQGGWGHGTSRGIEKIECKIPGVNKKGVEFPRVIKKTFCGISKSEASFCLEFPRVKWLIQKFQRSFPKKYILNQSNHHPPTLGRHGTIFNVFSIK